MNKFEDELIKELVRLYYDEESFSKVVRKVVQLTAAEAAKEVAAYSDHRLPASTYSGLLKEHFGLK